MIIENTPQVGKEILSKVSRLVIDFDNEDLVQTITDLTDTMRAQDLVGMAAPQIGQNLAVFVMEVRSDNHRVSSAISLRIFINPKILSYSGDVKEGHEGCGSVVSSGLFALVQRSQEIELEYNDEKGELQTEKFTGFKARIIQHEVDHLNGKLFLERVENKRSFKSREEYLNRNK